MKHFLTSISLGCLLYSLPLFAQDYLNIRYTNGSDKNVPFTSLQKVTFDETAGNVNIRFTDATTQTVSFTALQKLTSADAGTGTLLPVELVCLSATTSLNTINLSWATATEINNYGFEIEKAAISNQSFVNFWGKVGFVEGSGTTNAPKKYSFTDNNLSAGKYSYRLKQIDHDGKFHYTQAVEVSVGGSPLKFNLAQNFPNPFNPSTTIAYSIATESFVTIKVCDVVGREVTSLVNENKKAGNYEVSFDGSRLSSGVYICRMNAAAYSSITKMIITK